MNAYLSLGGHCPMFELDGSLNSQLATCKLADLQQDIHIMFYPGAYTNEGLALKTYFQESDIDTSKLIVISTDSPEVQKHFFTDSGYKGWLLSDIHHSTSIDYQCFNDSDAHAFPTHVHMNAQHKLVSYYQGSIETVIELANKR